MPELSDQLLDPARRPLVVADACDLIDAEVARTTGMSGMAIRSAYRVAQSVKPGAVPGVVDELLPAFAAHLEDYHQRSELSGRPLTEVLLEDPGAVADSLLGVADARVARTSRTTVRKAYKKVRGVARQHVVTALPGAAELVQKHIVQQSPVANAAAPTDALA